MQIRKIQLQLLARQDRVISEGHSYLPFVFESFGGTSGDSHEFTKKLISSISTRLSEPKSVVAISFYEKFSCILMRSVAKSLISRFPEFSLALLVLFCCVFFKS